MLVLDNVTKSFQLDEKTTITPVRNVTLHLEKGELVIIVGRSGTGKTTLLNLAAGLMKPTSGKVIMDGKNLAAMTDGQLSEMRNQNMGFIFQFPSLLPAFTVLENITLPSMFISREQMKRNTRKAREILEILGIDGKRDVFPKQLSAGEQKRVVVSRALINDPQLVLADEPTSDLDVNTETEVMHLIKKTNQRGVTFLMVTHNLQLLPFATRAYEMENGYLIPINKSATV